MDNGSIYTKNLINFLSEKKTEFISKKFDEVNLSDIQQFDSFILSGRRKNDRRINAVNSKIIKYAVSEKKSLLGICYGAEILSHYIRWHNKKIRQTCRRPGNGCH